MVKITLTIEGMSCGMCETHINDMVRRQFDIKKISEGIISSLKKKTYRQELEQFILG
jgi:hypothetical protein